MPENPVAFYRRKCLDCHNETSCGLNPLDRRNQNADDNCVSCHMPQVSTDIPHIAFTHHRVSIHIDPEENQPTDVQRDVVAFGDVRHLSSTEQQRCLGLAYAELSYKSSEYEAAELSRRNAIRVLSEIVAKGAADGEVLSTLAQFAWEDRQSPIAVRYAKEALTQQGLSAQAECKCRHILGDTFLQAGDSRAAADHLV